MPGKHSKDVETPGMETVYIGSRLKPVSVNRRMVRKTSPCVPVGGPASRTIDNFMGNSFGRAYEVNTWEQTLMTRTAKS